MALPILELSYADADAFRQDYEADLANGGAFVPTTRSFELRDRVTVRLDLSWSGETVELPGEVVHVVPPEMTGVGGRSGVAVQFSQSALEVRDRLAPLTFDPDPEPGPAAGEGRVAARKPARVATRIDWSGGRAMGCTRNLSRSGVLVGTREASVPRGEAVTVTMRHPTTGEEFEVRGRVARQVHSEGRVTAIGVAFDVDEASRAEVERFIGEVMGAEHTRRLGAISGPIAELGPHSIVQMLASSAPRGTIVLRRGDEEGSLCFDAGLQSVQLGGLSGMPALVQMLAWRDGTFEFASRLEGEPEGAPLPLEAAILEATRQLDEGQRDAAPRSFPLQARMVRLEGDGVDEAERSTTEAALLDLAAAGFTVSRALEVIPESDAEVFRALQSLIDAKDLDLR